MMMRLNRRASQSTCCRCSCVLLILAALSLSLSLFYFIFHNPKLSHHCAPCDCHCATPRSLITISPGLSNLFVTDCGKDDPDLREEMEKHLVDLLSEEVKLHKGVDDEQSQHRDMMLREARSSGSQYRREGEKCNIATATCEGARERAEALLIKEKKTTLLWQRRAKLLGWNLDNNFTPK